MNKRVLIPIANGTEEIEAVCMIDLLRRAGAAVEVASVESSLQITASRGVRLVADRLIGDCHAPYDLIVLPGGMPGAERLRDSKALTELLQQQSQQGRWYGAICAAPVVVLQHHRLLGERATAHPAFADQLEHPAPSEQRVVRDGHCITSRGPGTALEFSLVLVELLFGRAQAERVAAPLVMPE